MDDTGIAVQECSAEQQHAVLNDLSLSNEELEGMIVNGNNLIELIKDDRFKQVVQQGYLEQHYADVKAVFDKACESFDKDGDEEAKYVRDEMFKKLEAIKNFHIYLDDILSLRKFALERLGNDE